MKRKLCFLFALPLMFAACENVLPIEEVDLSSMVAEFTTPTKTVTFEGHVVDMEYLVTSADLETYLELQPNSPNGIKRPVKSVEAKGPNADVTLMYVVNYDKGWEIISADKRAQPVLAFSDGGEFSFETANPGEKVWLEGLACDVLNLRTADKALQTRAAEDNPNVGFWRGLEVRKKMMDEELAMMTRFEIPDSIDWPFEPRPDRPIIPDIIPDYPEHGHWELTGTTTESVPVDTVNHMTQTRWHQREPWNYYCPLEDGEKTRAGCVPIAGAQMLYFLHNNTWYVINARLDDSFFVEFPTWDNFNVWESMALDDSFLFGLNEKRASARLIRDVGERSNTVYGLDESRTTMAKLKSKVFDLYGVNTTLADYDQAVVNSSLLEGMPVIVSAYGTQTTDWLGFVHNKDGHAFIIDGYIRLKGITTYEYSWFYDEEFAANNPIDRVSPRTETSESPAFIHFVCMNWGWQGDYGTWFSTMGAPWHIVMQGENGEIHYNFDYDRKMLTGFSY